jgi:Xaa-Pro dipeptidase
MTPDYSDKNSALGALYPDHIQRVCERHDRALTNAGANFAVIFSGKEKLAFLDDASYPFKANPHFVSWAPLSNLPLSLIVYAPGEKPVLIYYQPRDYWHVVPGEPDGYWASHFDIRIVHTEAEVLKHLPVDRSQCVINPSTVLNILHYDRGIKTGYEIACMRLAATRGVAGHRAAESAFRDGLSELEIHRAYCTATGHTDNELPYGNIIALNAHGAVLHYTNLDRHSPARTRSFLIDAGASVNGYASDITRTYAYDDRRFAELIGRMETLQLDIVSRVKAGINYADLHIENHRLLAGVLVDAGLAIGDPDTLLETGVTAAFFPHGLGHLIGVQVHDVGGFMRDESGVVIDPPSGHRFLRLTRVLDVDMTLTIEPGLYAIDLLLENLRGSPAEQHVLWDSVDWLRPFGGIRIEDDVRVTADGCENLTRDAFSAAA